MIQNVRGNARERWWGWHEYPQEAVAPTRAVQDLDQHHQASHLGPTHGRELKAQRQSTILEITEVHPHHEYKQEDDAGHQAQSHQDRKQTHSQASSHKVQRTVPAVAGEASPVPPATPNSDPIGRKTRARPEAKHQGTRQAVRGSHPDHTTSTDRKYRYYDNRITTTDRGHTSAPDRLHKQRRHTPVRDNPTATAEGIEHSGSAQHRTVRKVSPQAHEQDRGHTSAPDSLHTQRRHTPARDKPEATADGTGQSGSIQHRQILANCPQAHEQGEQAEHQVRVDPEPPARRSKSDRGGGCRP